MKKIDRHELSRLHELTSLERLARSKGFLTIAGIDEAGRGPLAGPVVAAACIIPGGVYISGVNDSKQLSPKRRAEIYDSIVSNDRIIFAVGQISSLEIDEINIYQATIQAMLQAVARLSCIPDYLLVDGLKLPHKTIPGAKITQGDTKSQSIAAASIIAKETRDKLMREFHEMWPHYGFDQHKGYGTEKHRKAIEVHGPCAIHRMTFEPLKQL